MEFLKYSKSFDQKIFFWQAQEEILSIYQQDACPGPNFPFKKSSDEEKKKKNSSATINPTILYSICHSAVHKTEKILLI
jgi:hypothetical protein